MSSAVILRVKLQTRCGVVGTSEM